MPGQSWQRQRTRLARETLLAVKRVRPDILREFKERLEMLQTEHPLNGASQVMVQGLLDEVFAA